MKKTKLLLISFFNMKNLKFTTIGLGLSMATFLFVMNSCTETKEVEAVANTEVKASWSSCNNWATWVSGKYVLRNNIWGSANPGASWQCMWANSSSNWGATAGHTNSTGQVKGIPGATVGWMTGNGWSLNSDHGNMGKKHQAYNNLKVYWNFTASEASPTRYFSLIDIYFNWWSNPGGGDKPSTNIQLMTHWNDPSGWFDNSGTNNMTYKGQKTIDGITYKAYYKYPHPDNAADALVQIRPTTKTKNATHNIKAICSWLVSLGVLNNDEYVIGIGAGWEIIDGNNGANFNTNGFSVTAN